MLHTPHAWDTPARCATRLDLARKRLDEAVFVGYGPEQGTVFVEGESSVRYDMLSAVIRTIRDAEVYRIEVVQIRKKPLQ